MQITFFPIESIEVAPRNRARRDKLLNAIERRYYDFIPPGETDDDGVTHEEQQQAIRDDERALARMKVRETPKPPKGESIEHHVSFYSWLNDNALMRPIEEELPCPDTPAMLALAETLERALVERVLPVEEAEEHHARAAVELIDALREWAAHDFSFSVYVG